MNGFFNWNQGMSDYVQNTGLNTNTGVAPTAPNLNIGGTSGWNTFGNIMQGIGSVANAYTGFKQLGLARDQFNWQKDAYNTNLVNQANLVNSQLADRQRRRQFFDNTAVSPTQYLAQYGAASSTTEANQRQADNTNAWTRSRALNNVTSGG